MHIGCKQHNPGNDHHHPPDEEEPIGGARKRQVERAEFLVEDTRAGGAERDV